MRIFAQNLDRMLLRPNSKLFILAIILLGITSCQKTPDSIIQILSSAEKCMDANPDSAFRLLKSIPNPEILHGKAQADYCLLMTQAKDKNFIKHESDSLISFAVGYYGSHQENLLAAGKAYFYYGRVMRENNRPDDAMRYYLKAKGIFEGTTEYKILGLISEEIGNLNWKQDLYNEALLNFRDSREYYTLAKDMLGVSYALRNIGRTYLVKFPQSNNVAYYFYSQALKIAHEHQCSSEFVIYQELGMLYRARKDYKKSEYYLLKAANLNTNKNFIFEAYLSLGYLYFLMGKQAEAEKYFKLSLATPNIYAQIDTYNSLYRLEKQRNNLLNAIEYKEKADSFNNIVHDHEVMDRVADLQKKYDREKLKRENLQIKIQYQFVVLCCSISFFLVMFVACFFYYKYRVNKRRIREIEQQINENNEEIEVYQQKITEYELSQDTSIEYRTKCGELNGRVFLLAKQNKKLIELLKTLGGEILEDDFKVDKRVNAFRILISLKDGCYKMELSNSDWELLLEFFDFIYDGFVERLKSYSSSLTKHDLEICCLLKCGFTNEDLSRIFITNYDSVIKAKGRLKKRLNLSIQADLEDFIHNI